MSLFLLLNPKFWDGGTKIAAVAASWKKIKSEEKRAPLTEIEETIQKFEKTEPTFQKLSKKIQEPSISTKDIERARNQYLRVMMIRLSLVRAVMDLEEEEALLALLMFE